MHPFLSSIRRTVEKHGLIRPGEKILIGVSGGADSVSLLHGLKRSYGEAVTLAGVHVHHGLRGEEADQDADWVRAVCESVGLPCFVRRIDPEQWKGKSGESVQMLARRLRYALFNETIREFGADRLAVGHTADDQAETLLLGLIRGAGRAGLAGIPPCRPAGVAKATVIRPLIETTRAEVIRFLEKEGISYREDSSNQTDKYLRNRVRRHLLPDLLHYNPGALDGLAKTAEILRAEEDWLEKETARALAEVIVEADEGEEEGVISPIHVPRLLTLPLAIRRRVIFKHLRELSPEEVTFDHVERLLAELRKSQASWRGEKRISLPGGAAAIRDRDILCFLRTEAAPPTQPDPATLERKLHVPGTTDLEAWGIILDSAVNARSGNEPLPSTDSEAALDFDRTGENLFVRSRRPGDRFRPLGLKGTKKVQDFLVDSRVPRHRRDRVPLLLTREGEVAWLIGHRIDDRFKIRPDTRRVLRLKVMPRTRPSAAEAKIDIEKDRP